MKHLLKARRTATLLIAVLSLLTFSLFGLMAPPASAVDISKTFEFGPGAAQQRSHFRTFSVPSGLGVTAKIAFRRLGDAGNPNDIPIIIELRQPGATADQDGPLVHHTISLAERTQKEVTLTGAPSTRGCSLPWRVRVRYEPLPSDPSIPRFDVLGNITVTFSASPTPLNVDPEKLNIAKGNTVVKSLQGIKGSGTVRIRAEWHTSPLELLHFNSYHKLTVRLKRNGITVASQSGFSQHAPVSKTPKLDFTHFVTPDQASGNWQVEIESFAPADIVDFHMQETGAFKPGCN